MATSPFSIAALCTVTIVGAAFAACAQGNQLGVGGGGVTGVSSSGHPASSTTSTGTGGEGTSIGAPCPDGKCTVGTCTLVGSTQYCTTPCPPACPQGTFCSIIAGNPICVPEIGEECGQCKTAADCKLPSDACLTAPAGDSFCAVDCTVDPTCPLGFECVAGSTYGPSDGGVTDGGTGGGSGAGGATASSSSSSSSAGGGAGGAPSDGGTDGGTGGTGGGDGGTVIPPAPVRWCVPTGGASCPCNSQRNGVTTSCVNSNTFGTCVGQQTCNAMSMAFQGCTAMTPSMEICNGKDDNCNGMIDEGNGNTLCIPVMGQPPANSSWDCVDGGCVQGTCAAGFTDYPAGMLGCTCQIDADEPNDLCSMATALGTTTNTSAAPITVTGTLSSDTDVDVYSFTAKDIVGATSNSYHVNILFAAPAGNTEFVMDVERDAQCADAPTDAAASNITTYDWCVNGTSTQADGGALGESPCGPTAANHCNDESSPYFVRVHRAAGVTGTCTPYTLQITAAGAACPDWTQCQ